MVAVEVEVVAALTAVTGGIVKMSDTQTNFYSQSHQSSTFLVSYFLNPLFPPPPISPPASPAVNPPPSPPPPPPRPPPPFAPPTESGIVLWWETR